MSFSGKVTVGYLRSGRYDDQVFTSSELVQSSILPALDLTAQQVLSASLS